MRVGLFIPCFVDQFTPRVAIATIELLEKLGCDVVYPQNQTCCGQPLANAGHESESLSVMRHFVTLFEGCDYIVSPSGSCVLHVRERYGAIGQSESVQRVRSQIMELCEFLTDVIKIDRLDSSFPHRVGVLVGCHGLRGLRLADSSELIKDGPNKVRTVLDLVRDLKVVETSRTDECCGFGGTFAVVEKVVSGAMGRDRLRDFLKHGAEYVTGTDMSCLMHLEGIVRRNDMPLQVVHVAEILNGGSA
jgi:L-lactate dehydrogenase complex protein LldE